VLGRKLLAELADAMTGVAAHTPRRYAWGRDTWLTGCSKCVQPTAARLNTVGTEGHPLMRNCGVGSWQCSHG
jgi:hypothetical protein